MECCESVRVIWFFFSIILCIHETVFMFVATTEFLSIWTFAMLLISTHKSRMHLEHHYKRYVCECAVDSFIHLENLQTFSRPHTENLLFSFFISLSRLHYDSYVESKRHEWIDVLVIHKCNKYHYFLENSSICL